ncbi:alpha/beta fold hydrolase [Sphingomonas bacterium]|uniref:alpha/beta fold hydrolase n=1 Tax=Sphingomonas bacterium TaxID=1895847 RepID=UPI002606C443|nr:alpha/beta fold hydrolase [Sphingomonas bacterium]
MVETLWVEGAGLRTRVLASGDGVPLFLLHGIGPGMDADLNWGGTMVPLADHFRCYAIDLAGFGETSMPDPLPEGPAAWMALRVAQVENVMDALGEPSAYIVGNSRGGGAILLQMLLQAPDRVRGAVLMGAAGYSADEEPGTASARESLIKDFYTAPSVERMAQIVPLFFHDPAALPMTVEALTERRYAQSIRPGAVEAFRAMVRGGLPAAPTNPEAFQRIRTPMMLIHGGEDQISDPRNSLALARRLPGASLHILPAAGHWSHIDQPRLFVSLLRAFVDGALAPRA